MRLRAWPTACAGSLMHGATTTRCAGARTECSVSSACGSRRRSVCEDEWHDIVEWVFPLWLRFAAERRGLAAELLGTEP